MAGESGPDGLFRTAPQVVVDYFDRRPSKPTFSWRDIAPREHAVAFTVAKSAGFDILGDVRAAVRSAVVDRMPFDQFRAQLEPTLRAKGWWGERRLVDPKTGEQVRAQLGSLRRLKLIYEANIRSAEAAGDWTRIQQTKRVLPYLEYLTSVSERKRPEHLSWVGTTLPADDPWWATHFPPNGWNCKCRVMQRDAPRERTSPEKLRRPPSDLQPWRNARTGETEMVPAGIDPGWHHNPGREREKIVGRRLTERIDAMQSEPRRAAIERIRKEPLFRYVAENGSGFDHKRRLAPDQQALGRMRVPAAAVGDDVASAIGANSRVASVSIADAAKIAAKHPEIDAAAWSRVGYVVDTPDLVDRAAAGKVALWKRIDGAVWKIVLKLTAEGEIFIYSYFRARERALQKAMESSSEG